MPEGLSWEEWKFTLDSKESPREGEGKCLLAVHTTPDTLQGGDSTWNIWPCQTPKAQCQSPECIPRVLSGHPPC